MLGRVWGPTVWGWQDGMELKTLQMTSLEVPEARNGRFSLSREHATPVKHATPVWHGSDCGLFLIDLRQRIAAPRRGRLAPLCPARLDPSRPLVASRRSLEPEARAPMYMVSGALAYLGSEALFDSEITSLGRHFSLCFTPPDRCAKVIFDLLLSSFLLRVLFLLWSLFLPLFLRLSVSLFLCLFALFVPLFLTWFVALRLSFLFSPVLGLPICLFLCFRVFFCLVLCSFVRSFVCLFFRFCLFVSFFVCLFLCLFVCLFLSFFLCFFVCLFVCLFVRLFAWFSVACLFVGFFVCWFARLTRQNPGPKPGSKWPVGCQGKRVEWH